MLDLDILIRRYSEEHSSELPEFFNQILISTHLNTTYPDMASDQIQGRLLALLSNLLRPDLIVEVGTFTAYGTTFLAQGLSSKGKIITIEKNEDLKPLINKHLNLAGIHNKVEIKYGEALDILPQIQGSIDLAFIDANKGEYNNNYELIVKKVRSGGLIITDNTLWKGKVLEKEKNTKTNAIHNFNQMAASDSRVETLLLPYRDGLTIIRKK